MAFAQVNGINLYYELTGDAADRLVLVHGSWSDHATWDLVVPSLAEHFRVLTFDRRGHSRSEPSSGEGTFDQDVADLEALLEHLDFAPAVIVGNSFGATVVLGLAAQHPALFRGLSVHEPPHLGLLAGEPTYGLMLEEVNRRLGMVLEQIRQRDAAGGAKRFVETVAVGPGGWAQLPPSLRQTFIDNASTFLDESYDSAWLSPDLEGLARFDQPALLTHGDKSPPMFLAIVSKIAAAVPGADVQTLAGASHNPQISHPQMFVDMIAAFVGQSSSAQHASDTVRETRTESVEANKAIIRRMIEDVVNAGNVDAVDELLAPDFINHNPMPGGTPDRDGFKQAFRSLHEAFSDLRAINSDLVAEGDRVVALRGFEGTHDGPFMGVAATGKHITLDGIAVFRVVDGRVSERWAVLDVMGLMTQLGLIPEKRTAHADGK